MPANMMSAPVGSSLIVNGISMATVSAGPTPGSTPINVPRVTPRKPQSKLNGVSAMWNPCSREVKASLMGCSDAGAAENGREPAGRQVNVQEFYEEKENSEPQEKSDSEIPRQLHAAEAARDAGEENRLGEHETGGVDQQDLRDQADAHPDKGADVKTMFAARFRIIRVRVAPTARKRLVAQPNPEQNEAAGDHRRGNVWPNARVTAGARQTGG